MVVASAARRAGLEGSSPIASARPRHRDAARRRPAAEVGQLLRDREVETTAIYAKVDREALRRIARPGR